MTSATAARWSLAAAIATMAVWGANFAVTKHVLEHIGVGPFLFFRYLGMPLIAFALLAWIYRRRLGFALPRRGDWARFAGLGLLAHTGHVGIVIWGIHLSTAFSSALVLTSGPVFTLLILAALGAERLRASQVAGTLAALGGILVFLSDKLAAGLARAGLGDLALLFAAALFSLYTVLARPLVERYGPLLLLCWTLAFGAPPLLLASIPSVLALEYGAVPWSAWAWLAWAVFVSSFLGWLAWAWVNSVRGLARTAPLQYLMPPIAGVVAWLTLGETFTPLKLAAAGVTMAGVAWAQFGGGRAPPREAAQPDAG